MLDAAERNAAAAVQRYLQLRREAPSADASAALRQGEDSVSALWLALRASSNLPATDAPHPCDEAQALRLASLLDGGAPAAAAAAAPPTAARPAGAPAAPPPPAEDPLAPLLRLRASLASDVARLAASREALARDKGLLSGADAVHAELARDAEESSALVRAWRDKERRDLRWVGAAAALLVVTAAYIAARRLAWGLLGVRLW